MNNTKKNPRKQPKPKKQQPRKPRNPPTRPKTTAAPSMQTVMTQRPRTRKTTSGSNPSYFSHKEFIDNIYVPTGGRSTFFDQAKINPGSSTYFDFLSQLGQNFTEYRFHSLTFRYVPAVGSTTTTGQMGFITLAYQYNPSAAYFKSYPEIRDYDGSLTKKICDGFSIVVDCRKMSRNLEWYMCRDNSLDPNTNVYDYGSMCWCISGLASVYPAGSLLGSIECSYTVEFNKPRLFAGLGYGIDFAAFALSRSYSVSNNAWNYNQMWGEIGTQRFDPRSTLSLTVEASTSLKYNRLRFNNDVAGRHIQIQMMVTATSNSQPVVQGLTITTNGFSLHNDILINTGSPSYVDTEAGLIAIQSAYNGFILLDLTASAPNVGAPSEYYVDLNATATTTAWQTVWWRVLVFPLTSSPNIYVESTNGGSVTQDQELVDYPVNFNQVVYAERDDDSLSITSISSNGRQRR